MCERQKKKWEYERKGGGRREICISYFNTNALLGESRGLRVHVETLKGTRLSSEPASPRRYRETLEGLQYSLRAGTGAPWKLLNWEMSESGHRMEECFVSEGESSFSHQERSHKACSRRSSNTEPARILAHLFPLSYRSHKPYKGRSKNLFAGYQSVSAGF